MAGLVIVFLVFAGIVIYLAVTENSGERPPDGWMVITPGRPNYGFHHKHTAESEAQKNSEIKPFIYLPKKTN